jgi:hypothetical protein
MGAGFAAICDVACAVCSMRGVIRAAARIGTAVGDFLLSLILRRRVRGSVT